MLWHGQAATVAPFSVDSAVAVDTKKKDKPRRAASMSSMMSMDDEELTAEQRQCTKALREGKRCVHPPNLHSPPAPPGPVLCWPSRRFQRTVHTFFRLSHLYVQSLQSSVGSIQRRRH